MTLKQWLSKAGIEHVPSRLEGKIDSILDEQIDISRVKICF